jgi:hypothetical protein
MADELSQVRTVRESLLADCRHIFVT